MYHFLLYGNQWRYKRRDWERVKPIDTFALERILGVIGGPEVIVVREQPNGEVCYITLKNGFIDSVESVSLSKTWDVVEGFEITGTQETRVPVETFWAEELSL